MLTPKSLFQRLQESAKDSEITTQRFLKLLNNEDILKPGVLRSVQLSSDSIFLTTYLISLCALCDFQKAQSATLLLAQLQTKLTQCPPADRALVLNFHSTRGRETALDVLEDRLEASLKKSSTPSQASSHQDTEYLICLKTLLVSLGAQRFKDLPHTPSRGLRPNIQASSKEDEAVETGSTRGTKRAHQDKTPTRPVLEQRNRRSPGEEITSPHR
jgi:hypothetical protein